MPAFGRIGTFAGSDEPHPGFKVFMERPSDGGVYRAGRRLGFAGFEFPGYCVLGPN
jgi:hypothetical protein